QSTPPSEGKVLLIFRVRGPIAGSNLVVRPQRIIGVRVTVIYREPATSSTAARRLRKDGLQESRTHRLRRSTKTSCRHVGLRDQMPNLGGFSARTHPRQSLLR